MSKKDNFKKEDTETLVGRIIGIILIIFVLAISAIVVIIAYRNNNTYEIETKSIQGIRNDTDKFVLGIDGVPSDSIFNTAKYYVYVQANDGYILESLYTSDTEIVTTTGEPYIEGCFQKDGTVFKFNLETILEYEIDTIRKYYNYTLYLPEDYTIKDIETELKE